MFKISNVFKSVVYCYYLFWWFFFLQNKLHAISFAGKSVFAVDASSGSLLYSRKFLSEQPISIAVYDAESRRSVNSKYFSWINTYDLMRWMSARQQTFATKPYPHLFFFFLQLYEKYWSAARNIYENEALANLTKISHTRIYVVICNCCNYSYLSLSSVHIQCLQLLYMNIYFE